MKYTELIWSGVVLAMAAAFVIALLVMILFTLVVVGEFSEAILQWVGIIGRGDG
jgi:hypothetical protein